jgi:NAD(P)-dependent dehydrogenase (short-subunit alcohol dehydrogenase family)
VGTLDGIITLVTGAAQGIGKATAVRLATDGARVAVNARVDDERLAVAVAAAGPGAVAAPCDIVDWDASRAMVGRVQDELGPIEVLVANAARMTMKPFLEQEPEEWWQQIDVNLTGHLGVVSAVLPGMRKLGHGRIVIVSSYWGVIGWENATGYGCTKSGLIALTRALGRELAPEGIYVSSVAPGVIDTPQLEVDARDAGLPLKDMHAIYAKGIPAGRIGRADEVAATISFLAGKTAPAYVGQTLHPNGGEIRCSM